MQSTTEELILFLCPFCLCSTEAFSPERGARDGATKVMIVVTDGESHDGEELPVALEECEDRNITRYAIAVSPSLQVVPTGHGGRFSCKPKIILIQDSIQRVFESRHSIDVKLLRETWNLHHL